MSLSSRDLIRKEQQRQQLRSLVLEGAASPRTGESDAKYFESLWERAKGPLKRKSAQALTRST